MDVKEGFCWRCNTALHRRTMKCASCSIAEYCTTQCMGNDKIRHQSAECPTWSPKPCGNCQLVPAKFECSGCYSVHYCNAQCQKSDWAKHKPVCQQFQKIVKQVASRPVSFMDDYPFYFSNSFPNDLLNLKNNEMKDIDSSVERRYNVLLSACGDLRHMMKTVQSLPETFRGKLHFFLNDIDPFSMARNVLFLFMMSTYGSDQVSSISTIWLSLQLPRKDYLMLQETLSKLIEMDASHLKEATGGMIDINEKSYNAFREVWQGWKSYPCDIEHENYAHIRKQKNVIFDSDPLASVGLASLFHDVPKRHLPSLKKCFDDGMILPKDTLKTTITHCNPTFTGRGKEPQFLNKSPSKYKFRYCVRSDCIPFQMWDYLDMMQFKPCDSISVMCHAFHTHIVTRTQKMLRDRRLSFNICTVDFLELRSVINHQKYEDGFDRIYASNLIDYYRVEGVLEALEPFLSTKNPHAAIFTETFNWHENIDGAVWPTDKSKEMEVTMRGMRDCNLKMSDVFGRSTSCFYEYYDNTAFFVNFLRGDKYAEVNGKGKLPKMSDAINRKGLTMRDFRKERNRVVPFSQRVTVRTLNMLRGVVRTIEWHREVQT